jgi:hypothetical protein
MFIIGTNAQAALRGAAAAAAAAAAAQRQGIAVPFTLIFSTEESGPAQHMHSLLHVHHRHECAGCTQRRCRDTAVQHVADNIHSTQLWKLLCHNTVELVSINIAARAQAHKITPICTVNWTHRLAQKILRCIPAAYRSGSSCTVRCCGVSACLALSQVLCSALQ